jgi:hypothetical protein
MIQLVVAFKSERKYGVPARTTSEYKRAQGMARPEGSERAVQTLHVEGVEGLVLALVAA